MSKSKKDVVRVTISIPQEHHEILKKVALRHKVSLAWVVRDCIEKHLDQKSHFFGETINNLHKR